MKLNEQDWNKPTIRGILYEAVMNQVGRVFNAYLLIPHDRCCERRAMAGPVLRGDDTSAMLALQEATRDFMRALARALEQFEFPRNVDREMKQFWKEHAFPELLTAPTGREMAINMLHMLADTVGWAVTETFKKQREERYGNKNR